MPRRVRLQDMTPPRLLTEAETAHHLGLSAAEFSRRSGDLEAAGLPRRHPILGKRDRHAIDAWLDGQFGLRSTPEARRDDVARRIEGFGDGSRAN